MWRALPDCGLLLFKELLSVKSRLASSAKFGNLPQSAMEALSDVTTHMFTIQIRALNALRADFTNKLKAKLAEGNLSEDAVRAAVRMLWRDVLFGLIQVIVSEGWEKTAEGLIGCATQATLGMFFDKVWPEITAPLQALQNMIPPPLAQLDIVSVAQTVVEKIITKGCSIAFEKIFFKLEKALFIQG